MNKKAREIFHAPHVKGRPTRRNPVVEFISAIASREVSYETKNDCYCTCMRDGHLRARFERVWWRAVKLVEQLKQLKLNSIFQHRVTEFLECRIQQFIRFYVFGLQHVRK